jgi:hypothetical protein
MKLILNAFRSIAVLTVILAAAGCSLFVSPPAKLQEGGRTVCILFDETAFKNKIVASVSANLSARGYTVVTDKVRRAKYYPANRYGAVVYMAEYQAWHVPFNQKHYFKANGRAVNIVFVTTSGDPDVRITKPFDAITSASTDPNVEQVSRKLIDRLGLILH